MEIVKKCQCGVSVDVMSVCVAQPYRVFNTWVGDPSKVILLEALVGAIRDLKLLDNVKSTGSALVKGMQHLQVRTTTILYTT